MSTETPQAPASESDEVTPAHEQDGCQADEWRSSDDVLGLRAEAPRERALPIRPGDLTRLLMSQPDLSESERTRLGQFGKLLGATFNSEFYERLRELKERYAPIDPDSDYIRLKGLETRVDADPSSSFLELFESTLERANYRRLDLEVIQAAIEAPNELGLNYVPDFNLFEHLRVYVRGFTRITRSFRTIKTKMRKREVSLEAYQRLIIALKFKEGAVKLPPMVRDDVLYLRMFKDVPHVDMEMHLPEQGTKVKMRWLDKAQIATPFAVGLPTVLLKLVGILSLGGLGVLGLLIPPVTAGVNSFFGFQRAKHKHLSQMIRNLYYMTLANNSSILTRLIDSAEEEEYKETLLAYYFLWRSIGVHGECWNQQDLDRKVEAFLRETTGLVVDFEIQDALGKLFRLGLARRDAQGVIHPRPVDDALAHLDRLWDNTFRFSNPVSSPDLPRA